MAIGIRVKNANGAIQIDGIYKNLALSAKGTGIATTYIGGNGGGWYQGIISVTGKMPVLAFYSTDGITLRTMVQSGSTFTFYIWCKNQNQSFDWYIFDAVEMCSPVGNYGIRYRKANTNEYYFDSRLPYMRVLDFRSMFYDYTNGGTVPSDSASYSVSKIAVVPSQAIIDNVVQIVGVTPNVDIYTFVTRTVHRMSGGSFQNYQDVVALFIESAGSGGGVQLPPAVCRYSHSMILDVSGY